MTAVIYARYSSDSQREASIEGQLRDCKAYAEKNGITVVGTYIDRAYSAKTDDRPDFQRMIKDSAKKIFDVVLVWKLDRFARNRFDAVNYKYQLEKNGVHLVSAMEPISQGPEGIMVESMLIGMAEYYSAELALKVARGERENALQCKYNGGVVPLGFTIGKEDRLYHIDPETAPIVREIFTRYANGEPAEKIAASLNERGLRTRTGKPFVKNSFFQIFRNRRYIGEYRYKDIVTPGGIPAIVDEDLFNRVQQRFEQNKIAHGRPAKEDVSYLLTTKLFCGKCGTLMGGESGTSHMGNTYYYYKCGKAKRHGKAHCDLKAIRKEPLERFVVETAIKVIFSDEIIERLIDLIMEAQQQENTRLPVLKDQLRDTEKRLANLLEAIEQGILTPTTKQRLDELEARKEALNTSILEEELKKPVLTREWMRFWFEKFRKGDMRDMEHQRQIIDTFVNSVYVFDDRVVLNFNFTDDSKTISREEVLGSSAVENAPPYRMQSKPDAIAASGLLFAENRTAFHKGVSAQGNVFDLSCGRKAVALPAFRRASRSGLAQGYKMTARLFCTKRIHFLCAVCTGFVVSVWGLWYNNSKSAACAAMCMDAVFAAFGGLGAAQEMGGRAMRILGIDPGYAIVGFGALDYTRNTFTTLQYGAITTKAHTTFEDRLSEIYDDMTQLLAAVKPDAMAIETLFYTTNQKTVIAVAEARGVLLLCARQAGVPVFEYTPLQVKQSVSGYGKATKKQVQEMTRTLLKLPAVPKPDDTADALAMAICHAYSYRSKQYGVALTKRQQMGYF